MTQAFFDAMKELPQPHPYLARMESLCRSIPCLANMPECETWNPILLAHRWHTASGGQQAAIAFVLCVWDSLGHHSGRWEQAWGFPPFTIGDDFCRMDEDNQRAVAAWFANPFWP